MRKSMKDRVRVGNSHGDFSVEAIELCERCGIEFWLGNPDSSFLWQQKGMKRFLAPTSPETMRVDFCLFGTPWRKRTGVAANVPSLKALRLFRVCKNRRNVQLRGMHPALRKPWTAIAAPYPAGFSKIIALGIASDLGWGCTKLNIAGCCRSDLLRVDHYN